MILSLRQAGTRIRSRSGRAGDTERSPKVLHAASASGRQHMVKDASMLSTPRPFGDTDFHKRKIQDPDRLLTPQPNDPGDATRFRPAVPSPHESRSYRRQNRPG